MLFDLFMITSTILLYPKNIFIEDVMCGAGGRMRGAVHSSLIFSLFLFFCIKGKRKKTLFSDAILDVFTRKDDFNSNHSTV
jgi:hypothetical protein